MLARAGRTSDYTEIRLGGDICYNPLHNDLDPYAVAFAIATLVNNLFGKSKEPFWQQAYTDLLKFVISLRRITDGYTTLAEVYRYIIDNDQIDKNIRTLTNQFKEPQEVLAIAREDYWDQFRQAGLLQTLRHQDNGLHRTLSSHATETIEIGQGALPWVRHPAKPLQRPTINLGEVSRQECPCSTNADDGNSHCHSANAGSTKYASREGC
jgi:hypothetical protein